MSLLLEKWKELKFRNPFGNSNFFLTLILTVISAVIILSCLSLIPFLWSKDINTLGFYRKFILSLLIIGTSSFAVGCFIGLIFGFPHEQNDTENHSFKDVTDWLSKTLIGLGLVELKKLRQLFNQGVITMANELKLGSGASVIIGSVIIICSIAGFILFYFFTILNIKTILVSSKRKLEILKSMLNQEYQSEPINIVKETLPASSFANEDDLENFLKNLAGIKMSDLTDEYVRKIAKLLYTHGEYRKAVNYYIELHKRNPSDIYSLLNAGVLLSKHLSKHEQSNELLNSFLINKKVGTGEAYYNLACNSIRMNEIEKAKEYIKKALEIKIDLHTFAVKDLELERIKDYIEEVYQEIIKQKNE